jgi:hypothetical protein
MFISTSHSQAGSQVPEAGPLGNLDTVGWAEAARAASAVCQRKGYDSGFMTGYQLPDGLWVP